MWKASIGVKAPVPTKPTEDDDWDTDPNYVNNVTEKEQRWGSKTIEGSGHQGALNMAELRAEVIKHDKEYKKNLLATAPKPSLGYGGKFGIENDRVDKSAVDWSYKAKPEAHASQKDYAQGFGGKYGVQTDRKDKSAAGWEDRETLQQHESQTDYKKGFGGKFGVQNDRQDKSAVGWNEKEQLQQHESQVDYKKGFGGKFGVQSDRKDKSAVGWEDREQLQAHESQKDYKKGFGGQFGVQTDRKDKSAVGWEEREQLNAHESQTDYKKGFGGKFGVQSDRKDKSAVGWEEREQLQQHESQKDYKQGFGGVFGVQSNRQDKSAVGWEEKEENKQVVKEEMPKVNTSALKSRFEQFQKPQYNKLPERSTVPKKVKPFVPIKEPEQEVTPSVQQTLPTPTPIEPSRNVETPQSQPEPTHFEEPEEVPSEPEPPKQEVHSTKVHQPKITPREPSPEPIRQSSLDNEDEWKDNDDAPTLYKVPAAEMVPPEPVHNGASAYEYVPSEPQPTQDQYDFVPDEPPASEPAQYYAQPPVKEGVLEPQVQPQPTYEEPPAQKGGLIAVALYDYEKQDDDEIGFEINDIITDIEQIDAGWWRGMCRGRFGLFPANYVQLQHQ